MPEGISPWIAGGIAWIALLIGFILGVSWKALAAANDQIDDVFDTRQRGQIPQKAPPPPRHEQVELPARMPPPNL